MNRAYRRAIEKELMKKGMSKSIAKQTVEESYRSVALEEGQKVKLNYNFMKANKDWKDQKDEFKEWVEAHKNDVFTVMYEKSRKDIEAPDMKYNVNFVEDDHDPKWLLHSDTLTLVSTATVKLNDGSEVVVTSDSTDPTKIVNEAMKEVSKDE